MEFTQIQEISSFSHSNLKEKSTDFPIFNAFDSQNNPKKQQLYDEPLFFEVMRNLGEFFLAHIAQPQGPAGEKSHSIDTEHKNIHETNESEKREYENFEAYKKYDRTKSIMFNSSFSSRRSLRQSSIDNNFIRVFYFTSPIMKLIPYNKMSTVRELIRRALDTYLIENNDTVRATQPLQKFQMRLPMNENNFCPDMDMEPIHSDRVLSENMFETLVLVEKPKKETAIESKPTKEYSFDESNMSYSGSVKSQTCSAQTIKFILMDDTYYELMRIELDRDGNLEKLFRIVEQHGLHNSKQFVIKQDPQSEYDLTPDHQVKMIQKNRLYLMTKKYLDEAQDDVPAPIRLKTLIKTQQANYLPPIGINEASRYEEFQVTKISSLGIAIQRILGIDQTKIYNYQPELRQQKRQASLMDKVFGLNTQTGTKRPYRLIKDIKEIKKFPGGIEVVYPEKTTTYIIKNQTQLQKIHRKLSFLLDLNKINSQKQMEGLSPKKISAFFKF